MIKKIRTISYVLLLAMITVTTVTSQNAQFSYVSQNIEDAKIRDDIRSQRMTQVTKTGEGREFFLCFMMNFREELQGSQQKPLELQLFITSDFDTKVKIEFKKGNYSQEIFVRAGQIVAVKLSEFTQATLFEIEDVGQAVHITSDKPISVYGLNRRHQTTDSFLAFPVEVLGTEYIVMSYYSFSSEMQSTFAIVATEDDTEIEITPTASTSMGRPAGRPFKITLNRGNVYQVGAKNQGLSGNSRAVDLTGSYIKANKKIAVFGGHQCANVPSTAVTACNVLVEQLPPINTWGKHFYIGAFHSRSFYTYRVLASQDSTKVFEDTTLIRVLNRGEFVQRDSRRNIQIIADKPVLVAQYSQGSGNGDNLGDPMMLLITPVQQYLRKYRFATPVNGEWLHFINVFVPTRATNTFRINGKPVEPESFERFGNTRYSIASLRLPFGSHTVECSQPFGLSIYGFGIQSVRGRQGPDAFDAYGTTGGQSFLDYEPVPDTIPPHAEIVTQNRKKSILITDDGKDDTGLGEIFVMKQNNMSVQIPNFTQGAPSILVSYQPTNPLSSGSVLLKAIDMSNNEIFYTVCHIYDNTTNEFITVINKGDVECGATNRLVIGAFFSRSHNYYSPDFTATDNIVSNNKFSGLSGMSGIFGISLSRHLFSKFNITAKVSLITNNASFESIDSNKHFVEDSKSGSKIPYLVGKEIKLKHLGLRTDIGLDWKLSDYVYLSGGYTVCWKLNNKADIYDKLIFPPGYELEGGGTEKLISDKLNSLGPDGGLYIGPGLICNIGRGFQVFVDVNYYLFPRSILRDANLFQNQVNIKFGVKYQL